MRNIINLNTINYTIDRLMELLDGDKGGCCGWSRSILIYYFGDAVAI